MAMVIFESMSQRSPASIFSWRAVISSISSSVYSSPIFAATSL